MKKFILFICVAFAVAVSCSKVDVDGEGLGNPDFSNQVPVELEFGGLCVDGNVVTTKMVDEVSGNTHTFSWEADDKISMILHTTPTSSGLPVGAKVFNCSSNVFSASKAGATSTFKGMLPKSAIQELFGSTGGVRIWAIYPAQTLTVADELTTDYSYTNYHITGPSIPSVQDGTGFKYCYFVSSGSTFNLQYFTMSSSGVDTFHLSNALIKFATSSTKDIVKVEINGPKSRLSGDIIYYTGRYGVQLGVGGRSLTIENEGKTLSSELYFACAEIKASDTITFKFTASDNTIATKQLMTSTGYGSQKIYDLGTVTLDNWTPAE